MKKYLLFIFLTLSSLITFRGFADEYFTKGNVILTDNGMFVNLDGNLVSTDFIIYMGNGLYKSSQPYYGSCAKCGWPRDEKGKCTNKNCTGYGPPDRD